MPDPLVVRQMRQFKAQLLTSESKQMAVMAGRWVEVERRLDAQITLLSKQIYDLKQQGETISAAKLFRLQRYKELLGQINTEFARYAAYASDVIRQEQARLGALGIQHATDAIDLTYKIYGQMGASFVRLPTAATEFMVGLASDGSPLRTLLTQRVTQESGAIDRLTSTLINNTALGVNPRVTARQMKDDLSGGLQKALTIARTEQLRVYREASRMQYEASGVVKGYRRLCAHDNRVCAACLADEGTLYDVSEVMPIHVQDRCSSVPVVADMPELQFTAGEDWFMQQSADRQRSIMGGAKFEAWKAGDFKFKDLLRVTENKTWGKSVGVKSLKELGVTKAAKVKGPEFKMYTADKTMREQAFAYADKVLRRDAESDPDVILEKAKANLNKILDSDISIRRGRTSSLSVLTEERFKTQFETGMSGGTFNPIYRSRAENVGLGIPSKIDIKSRPVYGYFNAIEGREGIFGDVEFVLNPTVKMRTTYTVGDSLGGFDYKLLVGVEVNKGAQLEAMGHLAIELSKGNAKAIGYIEAQIQGGVKLEDVRKIVFHDAAVVRDKETKQLSIHPSYVEMERLAKEKGIIIEYEKTSATRR